MILRRPPKSRRGEGSRGEGMADSHRGGEGPFLSGQQAETAPLLPGSASPEARSTSAGKESGTRHPAVLVLDDEPLIRYSLAHIAAQLGATVRDVGSAEEAVAAAADECFALCFLDVRLPGMSGLEAMATLRRISPNTRIALVTGSHLAGPEAARTHRLADYSLPKPFRLDEVRAIVEDALQPRRRGPGG